MKLKFLVGTLFVGLFSVGTAWAASCGSFSMTAGSGVFTVNSSVWDV